MRRAPKIDLDEFAERSAHSYRSVRPTYEALASEVRRIIVNSFGSDLKEASIQKVEYRAKDVDSFRAKCSKSDADGSPNPKYKSPLSEITDLAGVRVIAFYPASLTIISSFLESNFKILEKRDVGEERYSGGSYGYQSIHFLVQLNDDRIKLPDYRAYKGLTCEIQVRTILQHAWAEMEHDIQYKTDSDIPASLGRRFLALAGMLEIADREFQAIQDEDKRIRESIGDSLRSELTKETIREIKINDSDRQNLSSAQTPSVATARGYISAKNYKKAIELYNSQIIKDPKMYTLYVGRAKAYFLDGDYSRALADLDKAKELAPEAEEIDRIREQLSGGTLATSPVTDPFVTDLLQRGKFSLRQGHGEEAFELFSEAEARGSNRIFAQFNKSMACTVAGDYTGAREFLGSLQKRRGTPMAICIGALECFLDILEHSEPEKSEAALILQLDSMPDFSIELSPLKPFQDSISKSFPITEQKELARIISMLSFDGR